MKKSFDRVPTKIKIGCCGRTDRVLVPEMMVRAVLSLDEEAKTRIRVASGLSEELLVKLCFHQESVLLQYCYLHEVVPSMMWLRKEQENVW